jgi:hypothetical protein
MLACCLIPIAGILAVSVFGVSLGSLGGLLPYALVLLCPIIMFFTMRGMLGEQGTHDAHHVGEKSDGRASPAAAPLQGAAEKNPPRCH